MGGFVLLHRVSQQCKRVESAVCACSMWSSLCSFGLPAHSGAQVLPSDGFGDSTAGSAGWVLLRKVCCLTSQSLKQHMHTDAWHVSCFQRTPWLFSHVSCCWSLCSSSSCFWHSSLTCGSTTAPTGESHQWHRGGPWRDAQKHCVSIFLVLLSRREPSEVMAVLPQVITFIASNDGDELVMSLSTPGLN